MPSPNRTEILPGLWVGDADSPSGFKGDVISVVEEPPTDTRIQHFPAFVAGPDGMWKVDPSVAQGAVEAIRRARGASQAVLVRCREGIERSPAIVVLYLVRADGPTLRAAYDPVQNARPEVQRIPELLPLSYEERTR